MARVAVAVAVAVAVVRVVAAVAVARVAVAVAVARVAVAVAVAAHRTDPARRATPLAAVAETTRPGSQCGEVSQHPIAP